MSKVHWATKNQQVPLFRFVGSRLNCFASSRDLPVPSKLVVVSMNSSCRRPVSLCLIHFPKYCSGSNQTLCYHMRRGGSSIWRCHLGNVDEHKLQQIQVIVGLIALWRAFQFCNIVIVKLYYGDAVALLIGHRTCDLQVAGSSHGWAPLRSSLAQGKLLTPVCLRHKAV